MSAVTRKEKQHAGMPGVLFTTSAVRESAEEATLQQIQSELSGGKVWIGRSEPVPQLMLMIQDAVDGMESSVIALWVPSALEADAASKLRTEGFVVE